MKKVLIISPHFPPVNAADVHRIRHMLANLNGLGWEAEIVAVDPQYIDSYSSDELLLKTIPENTIVHLVRAWEKKYTSKFGLGSVSMRSYYFYLKKVNQLLRERKFDLIFFSTTAFHVMALGPYWKRKFKIPFVLDIQDPWRSDFYLDKPKNQRPPKFWISYAIDKYLEKLTIPSANAIIAVSRHYIDTFRLRYDNLKALTREIPFSIDPVDFKIASTNIPKTEFTFRRENINIVYIGRGGYDLNFAIDVFFRAIKKFEHINPKAYSEIKCFFLGTSYAPKGKGNKTIEPIAIKYTLDNKVIESTDRLPYFTTLNLLLQADILFIPGSSDEGYTASKIYPYILAEKPIISIFNKNSSVVKILSNCTNASVVTFSNHDKSIDELIQKTVEALSIEINNIGTTQPYDQNAFEPYMSNAMTKQVVEIFDAVVQSS